MFFVKYILIVVLVIVAVHVFYGFFCVCVCVGVPLYRLLCLWCCRFGCCETVRLFCTFVEWGPVDLLSYLKEVVTAVYCCGYKFSLLWCYLTQMDRCAGDDIRIHIDLWILQPHLIKHTLFFIVIMVVFSK